LPVTAQSGSGRDGDVLTATEINGSPLQKSGIFALDKADLFNLLCIPPATRDADTDSTVYQSAMQYCSARRAMLIVDAPLAWGTKPESAAADVLSGISALNLSGIAARNAALYFPRVIEADPLRDGQSDLFVPCGIIAGVMARTDSQRGVWKAPAGLDAALNGIQGLQVNLTDNENGLVNPIGINCLRSFPVTGRVVWGARTLRGADQLADEYKYVPVRRTALFIEESLYRGTQWVVFEPNDEPLWAQIRLNVGAFMQNLFRQGAFQGKTSREAYFVKCDKETTTQNDINLGIVNILVGFAPLKPAEFVIIKVQQIAGQIET
jgi:phage tail sheath protein FI